MFKRIMFGIAVLAISLVNTSLWAQQAKYLAVNQPESQITFQIKSTLHAIKGQVKEFRGQIMLDPVNPDNNHGTVIVQADSIDTRNKKRDFKIKESVESETYPEIVYDIKQIKLLDIQPDGSGIVRFLGKLKLRKVGRLTEIEAKFIPTKGGVVCEGNFELNLNDFEVKKPSFLGVMKTTDRVKINFKVRFDELPDIPELSNSL